VTTRFSEMHRAFRKTATLARATAKHLEKVKGLIPCIDRTGVNSGQGRHIRLFDRAIQWVKTRLESRVFFHPLPNMRRFSGFSPYPVNTLHLTVLVKN
jgi:hypothetical protein